jgi:hypothetical protein
MLMPSRIALLRTFLIRDLGQRLTDIAGIDDPLSWVGAGNPPLSEVSFNFPMITLALVVFWNQS